MQFGRMERSSGHLMLTGQEWGRLLQIQPQVPHLLADLVGWDGGQACSSASFPGIVCLVSVLSAGPPHQHGCRRQSETAVILICHWSPPLHIPLAFLGAGPADCQLSNRLRDGGDTQTHHLPPTRAVPCKKPVSTSRNVVCSSGYPG